MTLLLPASAEAAVAVEPANVQNLQGNGEHVLVVEDMASVQVAVAEALTDAGTAVRWPPPLTRPCGTCATTPAWT